jgi:hypothetical protein
MSEENSVLLKQCHFSEFELTVRIPLSEKLVMVEFL